MQDRSPRRCCSSPARVAPLGALALLLVGGMLAGGMVLGACTSPRAEPEVSPLEGTTPGAPPHTGAQPDQGPSTDAVAPGVESGTGASPVDAELDQLLGRFDAAISALYADPLAAGDDAHPLSVAWLGVVVGGSQLDRQVRGEILAAGAEDHMRILPDRDGVAFANTALEVSVHPDGSVTWTNCGYAPGVGVDLDTGEVRDDNRTTTRGRGRAVRDEHGGLVMSELWDDRTSLLPPGEPDPCVALAAGTGGTP